MSKQTAPEVEDAQVVEETQELVKSDDVQGKVIQMYDFLGYDQAMAYAEKLIETGLIKFSKPEHAVLAFNLGRAMGLDPTVAATNIYVVSGKPTLSVHLITALAKKSGLVDWEIIEDGVEVVDAEGKQIPPYLRTTIKFYRYNPKMNRTMENTVVYTWTDAANAGLTSKDNWKRMPKNMLRARCLSEGIRIVAPDMLAGVFYESSEIADNSTKDKYTIVDDGNGGVMLQQA